MIICITNQKGGVGKTTTAVNLASALSQRNFSVLLIDMDPQGNATSGLGLGKDITSHFNLYDVLLRKKNIKDVIQRVKNSLLYLVPTDADLAGAPIDLMHKQHREYQLKESLKTIEKNFDFVFIDCPPSLGLLTVNALVAAQSFLIPLQCEYYALEGLSQLLLTASFVKKNFNPSLELEGILLTLFDARSNLNHQVASEVRSHFENQVFDTLISRNVRLGEAPGYGKSIFDYDKKALGAVQYKTLALEIEKKHQKKDALKKEERSNKEPLKKNQEKKRENEIESSPF